MTITDARVYYGLFAGATPVGEGVIGNQLLGVTSGNTEITCDIFYAARLTSTAFGDVVGFTASSGVFAPSVQTPTIKDGDGNDFEGIALPTAATIKAVHLATPSTNTLDVTCSGGGGTLRATLPPGSNVAGDFGTGIPVASWSAWNIALGAAIGQQCQIVFACSTT